jgi:hypothetical protein
MKNKHFLIAIKEYLKDEKKVKIWRWKRHSKRIFVERYRKNHLRCYTARRGYMVFYNIWYSGEKMCLKTNNFYQHTDVLFMELTDELYTLDSIIDEYDLSGFNKNI